MSTTTLAWTTWSTSQVDNGTYYNTTAWTNPPNDCNVFRSVEKSIFIVFGIFVNCIAVVMLNQIRRKTHSILSCLALLLAANDLFSCSSFTLSIIINTATCDTFGGFNTTGDKRGCDILGMLSSTSWAWSLFIIMVMSVERYLAIKRPFFHIKYCSLRILLAICAAGLLWDFMHLLLPLVGVGLPYFYYKDNRFCTLNVDSSIILMNGGERIAKDAINNATGSLATTANTTTNNFQRNQNRGLVVSMAVEGILRSIVIASCNILASLSIYRGERKPFMRRNTITDRAEANAIAFSRLTQAIAYTNVVITVPYFVRLLAHSGNDIDDAEHYDYDVAHRVTAFLLFLSPLVNPFLYVVSNKSCRKFIMDAVTCKRNCKITRTFKINDSNSSEDKDTYICGLCKRKEKIPSATNSEDKIKSPTIDSTYI